MAYVPNANTLTQPTGDKKVASAAPEFRAVKTKLAQTVRVPEVLELPTVPTLLNRAGKYFVWDAGGNPGVSTGPGGGDLTLRADLALPTGSSLSGFSRGDTGAAQQSVQQKLFFILEYEDYGAVGNEITDDTAAIARTYQVARGLGGATVYPRVGKKYLIATGNVDCAFTNTVASGTYSRETTVFIDKCAVIINGCPAGVSPFTPSAGGYGFSGVVFFDNQQPGTGIAPVLTRGPLFNGVAPARLIDWTMKENIFVNILDLVKINPGSLLGDCRFVSNRGYIIRFGFWCREWVPESVIVSDNLFSPGVYQDAAIVNNGAMLAKWTELNGAVVAIDMAEATLLDTVDGWLSNNNLWFGIDFARAVDGGFNVSKSTGDTFDGVNTVMAVTSNGFCYGMKFSNPGIYSYLQRNPYTFTRAFQINTPNKCHFDVDGGGVDGCSGDVIVIENSGDVWINFSPAVGVIGIGGQIRSGTCTISIATPGVITRVDSNMAVNDAVYFETTGALPTGLTAGTIYYVKTVISKDAYTVSATPGGAEIATSGTQSGVHTMFFANEKYVVRSGNPNAVVNFKSPKVDNKGGYVGAVGISFAEIKAASITGSIMRSMKKPLSFESTIDANSRVLVSGCVTVDTIGSKSLESSAPTGPDVVKQTGNSFDKTTDVAATA